LGRRLQKREGGGPENYTSGRMGPTLSPQIDKVSMKCKISFSSGLFTSFPLYTDQPHSFHPERFCKRGYGYYYIDKSTVVFLHRRSPSTSTLVLNSRVLLLIDEPGLCAKHICTHHYIVHSFLTAPLLFYTMNISLPASLHPFYI
jgi:hypothetical protein